MSQELNFVNERINPVSKLILLGIASIALLLLDNRYAALQQAKSYVATALYPIHWTANRPVIWIENGVSFFRDKQALLSENQQLKEENARLNMQLQLQAPAVRELDELKTLNHLAPLLIPNVVTAEIISNERNPQADRFLINKGSFSGVKIGDPVSDEHGLLGQVTLVQPASAEITLVNNTHAVIPAMVSATGVRTLVYGNGNSLDLRYFPVSAQLDVGDLIVTSGIDSIYPAGIPIAKVVKADRASGTPYYRVVLEPAARLRSSNYVLVIPQKEPVGLPENAASAPAAASRASNQQ